MIDVFIIILFPTLGIAIGSFINVLACRVPEGQSILGRSQCPHCRHVLSTADLIPLLSFFFLRGRCRYCDRRIGWRYPIVEMLGAVLFVVAWSTHPNEVASAFVLASAFAALLAIAVTDTRTQRIPDVFNVAFIALAGAHALFLPGWKVWGAIAAFLFFGSQWLLSRGRWIGSGDILLGIGIGTLMGSLSQTLVAFGLAYVAGAAAALFLLSTGQKTQTDAVAFAPFLALGTVGAVMMGERIVGMLWVH